MKFKTRIKIILPILISIIRILLIPFIIILNLNNKNIICIILIIIGYLTNILDDKIANKFYTKTLINDQGLSNYLDNSSFFSNKIL